VKASARKPILRAEMKTLGAPIEENFGALPLAQWAANDAVFTSTANPAFRMGAGTASQTYSAAALLSGPRT